MSRMSSAGSRRTRFVRAGTGPPPPLARWMLWCAGAEAVGMTAAAAAARASQVLVGEPASGPEVAQVLAWVVAGGLVEGLALGVAQSAALSTWLVGRRLGWVFVTLVVAGMGWAAGSVPAALGGGGGTEPSLLLVLAGAVGIGVVMGAGLGVAQAVLLRAVVPHPWRWVGGNVLGWAVAMPVVFIGAGVPPAGWSVSTVALWGTLTGLVAGTVFGAVSGWFLPSLTGASPHNRVVLAVLASPVRRLLDKSLVGLRLRGTVSGTELTLPVMYASDDAGLVVVAGHPERKRWWRNLREPAPVSVLLEGRWETGTGQLLEPGDRGYEHALATYQQRWPRVVHLEDTKVVRVALRPQP